MEFDAVKDLLSEVLNAEETVLNTYIKIMRETKSEDLKKEILQIARDEERHIKNAKEMLRILQE